MLPGGLLEEPGAKRSARDWIVDATMTVVALVIGALVFAPTEDQHSDGMAFLDVVLGFVAVTTLWWRRRWPVAVAIIASLCSAIAAFAAGAALLALFNVALRGSRRAIVGVTLFGVACGIVYLSVYPDDEVPVTIEILITVLITIVVIPWGCSPAPSATCCATPMSAPSASRPSSAPTSSRRARRSGGGSRARCTTCSRTGSRC